MKKLLLALVLLVSVPLFAQVAINGTSPANNAVNVPLTTTLKIWFNGPLDTTKSFSNFSGYLTSIDGILSQTYSANSDTMYMNVSLAPSTAYFIVFYWAPGQGEFAVPYGYKFTTGSSFTGTDVSGTVTSNSPGVTGAYAMVGLSDVAPVQSQPHFVAGTIADVNGNFTIQNAPNGTLYPIAAKDAVPDGNIDPSMGDAVALGASINVTGSAITGLPLVLSVGKKMAFSDALDSAIAFQTTYLPGSLLRRVEAYRADSAGNSLSDWQFYYYNPSLDSGNQVNVQSFLTSTKQMDFWTRQTMPYLRTIPNPGSAASSAVFTANCETGGGLTFRNQSVPGNWVFYRTLQLGQLYGNIPWQYIPDTTNFYWMAQYHFDINVTQDSTVTELSMWFIGNFSTGAILSTASVDPSVKGLPSKYSLEQNYPNPFNPSTRIAYALPVESNVTLEVYNLLGQKVATLVNSELPAGSQEAEWRPAVASGIYLYKLTAVSSSNPSRVYTQVRKMILMK